MDRSHVRGWDDNLPVGEEYAGDEMDTGQFRSEVGDVSQGQDDSEAGSEEGEGSPVDDTPLETPSQPQGREPRQYRQRGPARLEEDLLLLHETDAIFPYGMPRNQKKEAWQKVAANVNLSIQESRHFDHRRARERVSKLLKAHERHEMESLRASGTDEQYGERERLLTELAEQVADVEARTAATQAEREEEERQAGLLREAAMEGMRRADEPGDTTEEAQPAASQSRVRRGGNSRGAILHETLLSLLEEDRESREREIESRNRDSEAIASHYHLLERFLEQQERKIDLEDRRLDFEERRYTELQQQMLQLISLLASRGS